MTIEETSKSTPADTQPLPFGKRLQSTREAMNLERSEVASNMRLNEKIILMMEKNRYAADIPVTYIKGYLRSYAKLLNIPEHEIKKALDSVKPRPVNQQLTPNTKPIVIGGGSSNNYFMNIFTSLIIFSILGLIGIWWYSHNPFSSKLMASNSIASSVNKIISPLPDQTTNTNDAAASTEKTPPTEAPEKAAPAVTKVAAARVHSAANVRNLDDDDEDEDESNE